MEVHKYLSNLNLKKSSGADQIPNTFYKLSKDIICEPLCHILNFSIETQIFPDLWKQSLVIPIPKTSPPNRNEIRPISLLSTPSKLLERMILNPTKQKFESLYGNDQFGFRSNNSTTTALLKIQERIISELDHHQTRNVILIAADFSKAFDKVHHDTLLKKLESLPKNLFNLLKSYLNNRTLRIRLNDNISSTHLNITSSVPQGSILGPSLWCVY